MSKYDEATFGSLYTDGSVGKPFQTNTSRLITEAIMRQFGQDIKDSVVFKLTGLDTDVLYQFQDDFLSISNINGFSLGSGGSSASSVGVNSTEKAIGVFNSFAAAVADYASFSSGTLANILFGLGHGITFRCRCALSALSDGTNRYKFNIGFGDTTAGSDHTHGAYFRYSDNINGGKYQCVTVQASTETVSDSGITPVATIFDVFQIQVDATGTNVYFSINGTVVQTHTTNIPIGAAQFVEWIIKIYKTFGAVQRSLYTDWYQILITRTSAR